MDAQFVANEQNKNCTQRRKNEAGRMKAFICRSREQVRYGSPDDRTDDTEHDGPENGHVYVHHGLRYDSSD